MRPLRKNQLQRKVPMNSYQVSFTMQSNSTCSVDVSGSFELQAPTMADAFRAGSEWVLAIVREHNQRPNSSLRVEVKSPAPVTGNVLDTPCNS
jgi:hypothetical protein